jgi:hypothetical protein
MTGEEVIATAGSQRDLLRPIPGEQLCWVAHRARTADKPLQPGRRPPSRSGRGPMRTGGGAGLMTGTARCLRPQEGESNL